MMPQRASRRRILSMRACIVNLLSVCGRVVDGGEAGARTSQALRGRREPGAVHWRPLEARPVARRSAPTPWTANYAELRHTQDHFVYSGGQLGLGPYLACNARSSQSSKRVSLLVNAPVAV